MFAVEHQPPPSAWDWHLMDEAEVASEIERISGDIERMVDALPPGQFLLLAKMGQALKGDAGKLRLLTNMTLTDFVRDKFSHKYNIFKTPPIGRGLGEIAVAKLGDETLRKLPHAGAQRFRFASRFWAAFAVPLSEGAHVRSINLKSLLFRDHSNPEDISSDERCIPADAIAQAGISDRDRWIEKSIETWLDQNGLPKERFGLSHRTSEETSISGTNTITLLTALLASLDNRQKQRVSLPLDVIESLLHANVPGA